VQQTWRQDRVFFFGDDGTLKSLPTSWTDVAEPDVFVVIGAGRSPFWVADLLSLAGIVDGIRRRRSRRPQPVHRRARTPELVSVQPTTAVRLARMSATSCIWLSRPAT
jgi:hypothetical protein